MLESNVFIGFPNVMQWLTKRWWVVCGCTCFTWALLLCSTQKYYLEILIQPW